LVVSANQDAQEVEEEGEEGEGDVAFRVHVGFGPADNTVGLGQTSRYSTEFSAGFSAGARSRARHQFINIQIEI
jgi:hypothetical protein